MNRHKGHVSTITRAVLALALFGIPSLTGCDTSLADNSGAVLPSIDSSTEPGAESSTDQLGTLARAGLADLEATMEGLDDPESFLVSDVPTDSEGAPPPPPCFQPIVQLTQQCVQQTFAMTTACVDQIAQLFQNGNPQQAHQVAQTCIEQINQHTGQCLPAHRDHCQNCLAQLLENDAPMEVIQALNHLCQRTTNHILQARRGAVGAVKHAVDAGVAQNCVAAIHQIATGCAGQNQQIASNCVPQIEELLANGHVQQAVALAQNCIQQIRSHTGQCAAAILEHSQNCLQHLIRNCAEGMLIHQVQQAARENRMQVIGSGMAAIQQIRSALPPPPPPDG
ncbi:MAG: hypothetical protein O7F76_11835 [Planctomycetota bacterium]|nr:hypothetical protein [Planctomycetota bacterium]MCZ6817368.1 hypothetical protein [Planctomycetota bacterium]